MLFFLGPKVVMSDITTLGNSLRFNQDLCDTLECFYHRNIKPLDACAYLAALRLQSLV